MLSPAAVLLLVPPSDAVPAIGLESSDEDGAGLVWSGGVLDGEGDTVWPLSGEGTVEGGVLSGDGDIGDGDDSPAFGTVGALFIRRCRRRRLPPVLEEWFSALESDELKSVSLRRLLLLFVGMYHGTGQLRRVARRLTSAEAASLDFRVSQGHEIR